MPDSSPVSYEIWAAGQAKALNGWWVPSEPVAMQSFAGMTEDAYVIRLMQPFAVHWAPHVGTLPASCFPLV